MSDETETLSDQANRKLEQAIGHLRAKSFVDQKTDDCISACTAALQLIESHEARRCVERAILEANRMQWPVAETLLMMARYPSHHYHTGTALHTAAKHALHELEQYHTRMAPKCKGGCPTHEIIAELEALGVKPKAIGI